MTPTTWLLECARCKSRLRAVTEGSESWTPAQPICPCGWRDWHVIEKS